MKNRSRRMGACCCLGGMETETPPPPLGGKIATKRASTGAEKPEPRTPGVERRQLFHYSGGAPSPGQAAGPLSPDSVWSGLWTVWGRVPAQGLQVAGVDVSLATGKYIQTQEREQECVSAPPTRRGKPTGHRAPRPGNPCAWTLMWQNCGLSKPAVSARHCAAFLTSDAKGILESSGESTGFVSKAFEG